MSRLSRVLGFVVLIGLSGCSGLSSVPLVRMSSEKGGEPAALSPEVQKFLLSAQPGDTQAVSLAAADGSPRQGVLRALMHPYAEGATLVRLTSADPTVGGVVTIEETKIGGALWGDGSSLKVTGDTVQQDVEIENIDKFDNMVHGFPLIPPEAPKVQGERAAICDKPLPFPVPVGKGTRVRFLFVFTQNAALDTTVAGDVTVMMERLATAFQTPNFLVIPELAGTMVVNYNESFRGERDLKAVTNGQVPGVWAERDRTRADVVIFVPRFSDVGGIAWLNQRIVPSSQGYGYALVSQKAVGSQVAPHEVGHVIGMRHDRVTDQGQPSLGYNYGYIDHGRKTRTIMAYNKPCQDKGYSCRVLPVYSNEEAGFGTDVTAPNAADNRELLCRNINGVAAFRKP